MADRGRFDGASRNTSNLLHVAQDLRHTISMRWAIVLILALTVGGGAIAAQQVPLETMNKLSGVFTDVRDQLWEYNEHYWHQGEFNRCIATMRLITSIDPHDTQAYENAAWLMDSDSRGEDAEAYLVEGLRNNPNVFDIYLELGCFYYFRTRYAEAVPLYEACMVFPDSPLFTRHQLAHAYEQQGLIGDALETWLEAEAADPNDPVPAMHIDRMLKGGEPSHVPDAMLKSVRQRQQDKLRDQQLAH